MDLFLFFLSIWYINYISNTIQTLKAVVKVSLFKMAAIDFGVPLSLDSRIGNAESTESAQAIGDIVNYVNPVNRESGLEG